MNGQSHERGSRAIESTIPSPTARQRTQHEAVLAPPAVSGEDLATVAGHEAERRTAELLTQPPARLSRCTATDFLNNRARH